MINENEFSGILVKTFYYKASDEVFADIYQCENKFCIVEKGTVVGKLSSLEDAENFVKEQLKEIKEGVK